MWSYYSFVVFECLFIYPVVHVQANTLLSAMAFADLAFLVSLLPHSLASFRFFYSAPWFQYVFQKFKPNAVAIANMFSISATWCVFFAGGWE